MTNILAWNIRGLNSPNKQEDIKGFLHKQKVGLVVLLETKVHKKHIEEVTQRLFSRWQWFTNVEHNPKVRILVAWKEQTYRVRIIQVIA